MIAFLTLLSIKKVSFNREPQYCTGTPVTVHYSSLLQQSARSRDPKSHSRLDRSRERKEDKQ